MARKKAQQKSQADDPNFKLVCRNRKARHNYDVIEELECGIALTGSEVKSIRAGKISIDEAFARIQQGELWLIDCDIAEYPQATVMNHEPKRRRKLLVHKRELKKFAEQAESKGLTLVPTVVYFSKGRVKVKVAVARGRKTFDKREKLREKTDKREMQAAMRRNR